MSWSSANSIFDPIAEALIEEGSSDDLKTKVLGILIGVLRDGDWDTPDESLDRFADDPAIVAAFREHEIVVPCSEEGPTGGACELEQGHLERGESVHAAYEAQWDGGTPALIAEVADTLRRAGLTERQGTSRWTTTAPGFEVTTSSRADAVQIGLSEPSRAEPGPRCAIRDGRFMTSAQLRDLERRDARERGRIACTGYLRALRAMGWHVEDRTGHNVPHIVVTRRQTTSDNELV